jgi:tetratricopeptide (TPR) repeat protein
MDRKFYEDSVAEARKNNDKKFLAGELGSLGNICASEGDVGVALQYLNESLEIYRSINSREDIAQACYNLAGIYEIALRDYEKAMYYLELGVMSDNRKSDRQDYAERLVRLEIRTGKIDGTPLSMRRRFDSLGVQFGTGSR